MKKDFLSKNLVLLILLFIMGGVCTISLKSFYRGNIIEILSNDLYKSDVTHCVQTTNIKIADLLDVSNDTFISKVLSENTRAIYFSSKYKYNLPVVEGRFFNYDDFEENNNYVVVGQNLNPYLYYKNNKTYLNHFNVEYEVIGVVGFDIKSTLDDIIIFNLINIYDKAPQKTDIIFGVKPQLLVDNIKYLQLNNGIKILDIPYNGISRIWSAPNIYITIIYITYICCNIAVLFLIYLKSYYYGNYVKVFKILGFNKKFIYKNVFMMESFIYTLVFSGSVLFTLYVFVEKIYINKLFVLSMLRFSFLNYVLIILCNLIMLNNAIRKIYVR